MTPCISSTLKASYDENIERIVLGLYYFGFIMTMIKARGKPGKNHPKGNVVSGTRDIAILNDLQGTLSIFSSFHIH